MLNTYISPAWLHSYLTTGQHCYSHGESEKHLAGIKDFVHCDHQREACGDYGYCLVVPPLSLLWNAALQIVILIRKKDGGYDLLKLEYLSEIKIL